MLNKKELEDLLLFFNLWWAQLPMYGILAVYVVCRDTFLAVFELRTSGSRTTKN